MNHQLEMILTFIYVAINCAFKTFLLNQLVALTLLSTSLPQMMKSDGKVVISACNSCGMKITQYACFCLPLSEMPPTPLEHTSVCFKHYYKPRMGNLRLSVAALAHLNHRGQLLL